MTVQASPAALIQALGLALERQRQALVARDADALVACGNEVMRLLDALRAHDAPLTAGNRRALERALQAQRVNAELLDKAAAAGARAMRVLFDDGAATYGRGSAAPLARPSRPISAA